jgi:hypothetical protein
MDGMPPIVEMIEGTIRAGKGVGLLASSTINKSMAQPKPQVLDEDVKRGIRALKLLLKNPAKFEEWANETLDMSRLRKR